MCEREIRSPTWQGDHLNCVNSSSTLSDSLGFMVLARLSVRLVMTLGCCYLWLRSLELGHSTGDYSSSFEDLDG